VPVIVLTGQGDRDVDVEAARAGAADYLVKGEVSPALLERAIRYAMRSHADLRTLRENEDTLQKLSDDLEQRVNERTIELKRTIKELAAEKQRVESLASINRAVLDATVDGIHMVDRDGTTLVANSALERLVTEGDTVVVIGEWTYTGLMGKVRQPSVSVVDVRDGQIWRDLEYVGLAI